MSSNPGKRFEEDFARSVPEGVYFYRLKDAGGWATSGELRFTPKNDYDHLLYRAPWLFTLELKSVADSRWSFQSLRSNQEAGLLRAAKCKAVSGVLLNFRREERTFFIDICALVTAREAIGKKSLNVADAEKIGLEVEGTKLHTRYRYDVRSFIEACARERTNHQND
jgi:penicillin-binding protein-related factor A (putative recombinase)